MRIKMEISDKYQFLKKNSKEDEVNLDQLQKNIQGLKSPIHQSYLIHLLIHGKCSHLYKGKKKGSLVECEYDLDDFHPEMQRVLQKYFEILNKNL